MPSEEEDALGILGASRYEDSVAELWAGAASVDVTPPVGIAFAGWSNQLHEVSSSNHRSMKISALVAGGRLRPGAAIVVFEVCALTNPQAAELRAAIADALQLPPRAIRVSATHTHSCPAINEICGSWIRAGRELADQYWNTLIARAVDCVVKARSGMRPAQVRHAPGSTSVPVYRRVQTGGTVRVGLAPLAPVRRQLDVICLDDSRGERIATLLAMAAHPTILSGRNEANSPDYPGVAREIVEEATHAPCLFLQGATADVGPRRSFTDDLADVELLGTEVAHHALALTAASQPRTEGSPPAADLNSWLAPASPPWAPFAASDLAVLSADVSLPLRSDLGTLEQHRSAAEAAADALYAGRSKGLGEQEIRNLAIAAKRAAMQFDRIRGAGLGDHVDIEVHVVQLGPVALTAVPVEPFWRAAESVEAQSPAGVTILSGYSNGYHQYLPRLEDYPVGGYEVQMTPFAPGAAERLEAAVAEACHRIRGDGTHRPSRLIPRVVSSDLDHPEGVAVDREGFLWSGGEAGQVYRISPLTGVAEVVATLDSQVLGVAIDKDGSCVCCTRGGRVERVHPDGTVSLLFDNVEGRPLSTPNFPVFDWSGRLYVSGSGDIHDWSGEIYCHEGGRTRLFHRGPLPYPNGMAVAPDGEHLYVALTATDNVVRFRLDGPSDALPEEVCPAGSLPTMPDGVAFDNEGTLYVTSYGRDCVYRILPDAVEVLAHDPQGITANRVTNCAFAGGPSTELYLANFGGRTLAKVDAGVSGLPLFSQR